jgi:hypothetical protein
MSRFVFVVYSNPTEGKESQYNDWYSHRHLQDLMAIPGVTSARRFKWSDMQLPGMPVPSQRYLAIYEVEATDKLAFQREMFERQADGRMPVSETLSQDGLAATFWDPI